MDEVGIMTNRDSQTEKIISKCLSIDDQLKVIKKALRADGEEIDGFNDHYSDLIQQIIDLNWQNHDLAYELSSKDHKLDRIKEIVN